MEERPRYPHLLTVSSPQNAHPEENQHNNNQTSFPEIQVEVETGLSWLKEEKLCSVKNFIQAARSFNLTFGLKCIYIQSFIFKNFASENDFIFLNF